MVHSASKQPRNFKSRTHQILISSLEATFSSNLTPVLRSCVKPHYTDDNMFRLSSVTVVSACVPDTSRTSCFLYNDIFFSFKVSETNTMRNLEVHILSIYIR